MECKKLTCVYIDVGAFIRPERYDIVAKTINRKTVMVAILKLLFIREKSVAY